jgi:hypothetical protein
MSLSLARLRRRSDVKAETACTSRGNVYTCNKKRHGFYLRETEHDGRWSRFSEGGDIAVQTQPPNCVHRRAEASEKEEAKIKAARAREHERRKKPKRRRPPPWPPWSLQIIQNQPKIIARRRTHGEPSRGSCPQRIRVHVGRMRVAVLSRPASQAPHKHPEPNPTQPNRIRSRVAPGPTTA